MDFEKLYQHSALLRHWLNLFIMIIIIVVVVSIFIIIIHRESATPQQWWHVGWMFITSLSSPGASTTSGPPYQQVQLFLLAHNSAFLGSFSRRKKSHNLKLFSKIFLQFEFSSKIFSQFECFSKIFSQFEFFSRIFSQFWFFRSSLENLWEWLEHTIVQKSVWTQGDDYWHYDE